MPRLKTELYYLAKEKGFFRYQPTAEDLKTWLRTEHKIHVSINVHCEEEKGKEMEFYETNIVDVKDDWNTFAVNSFYEDYDIAMDEVLEKALGLIKHKQ